MGSALRSERRARFDLSGLFIGTNAQEQPFGRCQLAVLNERVRYDWDRAIAAAEDTRDEFLRAKIMSLGANSNADLMTGLRRINASREIDPLNPLHSFRLTLLYCQFGTFGNASAILDSVREALPKSRG